MKILLASLLAVTPVSASIIDTSYQEGYSKSRNCFTTEYREEYVPVSYTHLTLPTKRIV